MQLVVLGPLLPFRGGIARHTTFLLRHLAKRCQTYAISFSQLYPGWLYPGTNIFEPGYQNHKEHHTEYFLNSINPLSWFRTAKKIEEISPNAILIAWWSIFLWPCYFTITYICKKKKICVIFLCHNVMEHETAPWRRWATKLLFKMGDKFIVQSESELKILQDLLPMTDAIVHPHPTYEFPLHDGHRLTESKKNQGIIDKLYFGIIRRYKGVDILLKAFNNVTRDDIRLHIVGEIWHDKKEIIHLVKTNRNLEHINFVPKYIPEEEIAAYFLNSDILVLPYLSASGSGIASISRNYKLPIIATRVGDFPDLVSNHQTGLLISPGSIEELSETINHLSDSEINRMKSNLALEELNQVSWGSLANQIIDLVTN